MILVVLEHDRGEAAPGSWEAMTAARGLAEQLGVGVSALIVGAAAEGLVSAAHEYGAAEVHLATHALLSEYGPETWGETVAQAAVVTGASYVLACGTDRGNEVAAQAAARMEQPMVANCTEFRAGDDGLSVTRVRWGGSLLEEATVSGFLPVLTVAHHAVEPVPSPVSGTVTSFEPELDPSLARTTIVDRVVLSEGITLATAPVVVGGGRGVGSAEGFAVLEELAELLGGVVGCSRVVTNNGWRPHSDQVGQTGTKIAPQLYIACGISGAIQHWVGAMASKHILAINTDPEANMVTKADYAVIGDLHEVLPAIAEAVRSG